MSRVLRVRVLVLVNAPKRVWRNNHVVLKHLSMDSGLRRSFKSSLPRSMHDDPILQANASLICSQISAIRMSSVSTVFWVGPRLMSAITPLLILSAVA